MKQIPCNQCGGTQFLPRYSKKSPKGVSFAIVTCKGCGLVQVNPQPSLSEVLEYYTDSYFTQRTDRGYDNYYSKELQTEISRVFQMNLNDLGFFVWEAQRRETKPAQTLRSLDIGCAAGYFVSYMKSRGYEAFGIEIADGPVQFARNILQVPVIQENFLEWDLGFSEKFDVITLWATIEHLHQPKETLEKIQKHLKPGGLLILSTCRFGILAKLRGVHWRYLNVPEHLYYFSLSGLTKLLSQLGYYNPRSFSYGSGMTAKKNSSFFYKIFKQILDKLVKQCNQGDMMVIQVESPT